MGYEPVWQDIFGTEQGDLRAMLRQKIDECEGVVQLVGKCYGAEPPAPDEQFGRVSYTQYEALYARSREKKVWYLFLDESFPGDAHRSESVELGELQAAYRRRLKTESQLYHTLSSREALEASVLKLRNELTRLRRGFRQWAALVAVLLVLIAGAVGWLVHSSQKQGRMVETLVAHQKQMEQALIMLADAEMRGLHPNEKLTAEEKRARAYALLERELGLTPGTLAKDLPAYALVLFSHPDTTPLMRARAAYALGKYEEAEKLSAEVAEAERQAYQKAQKVAENQRKNSIEAFTLAAGSADARIDYAAAMKHLRDAEGLTDRARVPLEWASLQWKLASVLYEQGQYAASCRIYSEALAEYRHARGEEDRSVLRLRSNLACALGEQGDYAGEEAECRAVIKLQEKVLGPEHPDTLSSRNNLAVALDERGKYSEAESEDRAVIKLQEKVLGPEHSRTIASRDNLATVLEEQGKYAEAETEYRAVIKLREKVLGPDHPDTLSSRSNLITLLNDQEKHALAEIELRTILKLREKVLGPDHPDTLDTRNNLAVVLCDQGKYAEAETDLRAIIQLRQRTPGPEHPITLGSRSGLAGALGHQRKYAESEAEYRAVIKLQEKVLGPGHPDTLDNRNNLAMVLFLQDKDTEAEAEFRAVLKLREKALGPEHPDTLRTCYNLAVCLLFQKKLDEAKTFAQRAAEGARKTLGPSHPSTLEYEKGWQKMKSAN